MTYSNARSYLMRYLFYGFSVVGVVSLAYLAFGTILMPTTPVHAQQDPFLSQRINMIEQRFNTIESRINRLESDSRYSSMASRPSTSNDSELRAIQTELDGIRLRMTENECALVKLDERTLSASARAARARTGVAPDPCRLDPATPLRLLARPH